MMRRSLNLPRLSCLFAAAFLLASFACGSSPAYAQDEDASPEERAKVRVFEALDLMDAGSYGEARLMLQLALGLNSSLDRAWYYLTQCNVELKKWDDALEALSKYEAAELSEHERMQIVDMRTKIQTGRAASEGDGASADTAGTDKPEPAAQASSNEPPPPSGDTPSAAAAPAPGPMLMIVGSIVAGVGAAVWASGGAMAQDSALYEQGRPAWFAGIGMVAAGGASLAVGIPLTIKGMTSNSKVAFSFATDDKQNPSAAMYLVGKW